MRYMTSFSINVKKNLAWKRNKLRTGRDQTVSNKYTNENTTKVKYMHKLIEKQTNDSKYTKSVIIIIITI